MTGRRATNTTSALENKLYEFFDVLRDAGIAISTEEVLTLFKALPHISILEKPVFRQALKTTLVKDYTDIPVFEKCFEDFFGAGGDVQAEVVNAFREMHSHEIIKGAMDMLPEKAAAIEKALEDFIRALPRDMLFQKSPEEILAMFMEEREISGSSGGLGVMPFNARSGNLTDRRNSPDPAEVPGGRDARLAGALMNVMQKRLSDKKIGTRIRDREEYLLNKPLYNITPEEMKEMRGLIRRFGQKLKNRISLRKKRVKHGGMDIKRMLRQSLQYGGVPFKIFHKDKKIDRPELVALCDISGSVNQYSRFMLLLTYTLQSLFSKVRTFAFVSTIVEITPLFMEMDPERALNSIFGDTNFTYGWGSNYGRCFEEFVNNFSSALTHKTTVLVLGDGRNNYQGPGLDAFMTIKERSRNILWLNPDKKHLWSWGDSIASVYREYCDEMREVNNFLDLSEFIDKLFMDF